MTQYWPIHQIDGQEAEPPVQTTPDSTMNLCSDGKDQQPAVVVLRADPEGLKVERPHRTKKETGTNPWTPGAWKRFPWAGAGSILLIICLTAAALSVVIASNHSHVDRWRVRGTTIQPQVWLSVLTTIMDGLMVFLLVDGGTVYFWRQALHGIKLRDLHDYHSSLSIPGAIKNLFQGRYNPIGLACLLCLASGLRGPLFQRASVIKGDFPSSHSGVGSFKLAQAIPPGFFFGSGTIFSEAMSPVYDEFSKGAPIQFDTKQCSGTCTAKIKGFGFGVNCSTTSIPPNSNAAKQFLVDDTKIGDAAPAFVIQGSVYMLNDTDLSDISSNQTQQAQLAAIDDTGRLNVTSVVKSDPSCNADLSVHTCSLHRAIVEYDVIMQNGTIVLQHAHWQQDAFYANLAAWDDFDALDAFDLVGGWTVTGVWTTLFNSLFKENIALYLSGDGGPFSNDDPSLSIPRMFVNNQTMQSIDCNGTTFRDPTQYVVDRMRELAFRTAVHAAQITDEQLLFFNKSLIDRGRPLIQNWTQSVQVNDEQKLAVYTISIPYMIAAALVSLLAVPAVSRLYFGWWELGRNVSLDPLEVAKAFDAPHLEIVNGNAEGQDVAKRVGLERVRYGVIHDAGGTMRGELKLYDEEFVRKPKSGEIFK